MICATMRSMHKDPICLTREEVEASGKLNHPPYSVLSEAFLFMLKNNLRGAKLYHSDVYHARTALHKHSGYWFPLDRVEKAMRQEGWAERSYRRY